MTDEEISRFVPRIRRGPVRRKLTELMARSREVTRGTPEGAVDAEIGRLRGDHDGGSSFAPSVWIVNCTEEVDGLYVFQREDQAREHAARYGDSATVSEEIVMNGSAGAQFLIDTADECEPSGQGVGIDD